MRAAGAESILVNTALAVRALLAIFNLPGLLAKEPKVVVYLQGYDALCVRGGRGGAGAIIIIIAIMMGVIATPAGLAATATILIPSSGAAPASHY